MRMNLLQTEFSTTSTPSVASLDLRYARSLVVEAIVTSGAATATVFTAAVSDICTATAHGFTVGRKGQATTTTTLPAGLSLATDYFFIPLTADTFSLASSYALAIAGTAIDITSTGTGTHTFTPTAIAGASVKLQGSNDGTNWVDVASSSQNITATVNLRLPMADIADQYVRAVYTLTAGQLSVSTILNANEYC